MTPRYVSGCGRFILRMPNFVFRRLLLELKKMARGTWEWVKACKNSKHSPQKLKTHVKIRFASKVIIFKETFEFDDTINLCYSRQTIAL
jgi:hypothetical protein